MIRLQRAVLWMIMCLLLVVGFPISSSAHAFIVKSTPTENETFVKAPKQVSILFNEEIQPVFHSLEVINDSGVRVDLKNANVDKQNKKLIEADLKRNLPKGIYTVKWKVVSSDGHPIEGTIPFEIGKSGATTNTLTSSNKSYFPGMDMVFLRWLLYLGFSLYLGNIFNKLFIYPKNEHNFASQNKYLLWIAYFFMAVSLILNLPLQTTIEASVPWSDVFKGQAMKEALFHTSFGKIWLIEMILLLLLAITSYFTCVKKSTKLWALLSLVFGIGLVLTKAFIGHAPTAPNPPLAIFMDFVHILVASIWLGNLLIIAFILPLDFFKKGDKEEKKKMYWEVIQRFSFWGLGLVFLLLLSGVYGSIIHIPTFHALYTTLYGKILLGKVALLFIMLLFAAYNFFTGKRKKRKLGMTVWLEFGAGLIALVLAAMLTNLPTAETAPGPFAETQMVQDQYVVDLKITPNILGMNQIEVDIKNKAGKPMNDIEQVTVKLTSLEMNMGDNSLQLPEVSSGIYRKKGMLSMVGKWTVHVHVLTKSLQGIDADFKLVVGSQ